jgi:uncharacterized protein (TIGR02594 family)
MMVQAKFAHAPWMAFAWSEIGTREIVGPSNNPRILALYRDAGFPNVKHDEVAWCAAFVGAALQRSAHAGTKSLMARSYMRWGEALTEGRLGAIAVFTRGSDPALGHVAFYLDGDDQRIYVLGGNQGDAVSVMAIDRSRLLGLRWPGEPIAQPTAVPALSADGEDALFDIALAHVLKMEGGWTEDPYDPGGPTNFGITLATLAAHRGVPVDVASYAGLRQALRAITQAEVRAIYVARYWRISQAQALPPQLALMHFDATVNHGAGASSRMLQEAVGVEIDGEIGPQTLAACSSAPVERVLQRYAEIRRARYRALQHFWRFGRGWLARVEATYAAAKKLTHPQPTGDRTMTDIKQITPVALPSTSGTSEPAAAKWWGQSLTVWGAMLTAASTVIPALGPLVGIDITADMVRQTGTQVVQVIQAVGGIAGTVMTLYGRMRATTRLERQVVSVKL